MCKTNEILSFIDNFEDSELDGLAEKINKKIKDVKLKSLVQIDHFQKDNWCELNIKKLSIKSPNLTLVGQSIAGCRSSIVIPEIGIVFDYGINTLIGCGQPLVAITHGHADHMGSLHFHAFERRMHLMADPTYLMPEECIEYFNKAFDAYKFLNRHGSTFVGRTYKPIGIGPVAKNVNVKLLQTPKGKFIVKAFATDHTVPSVGYIVYEIRKKLLPEFTGMDSKDIAKIAKTGKIVSEIIETPIIGYTGDTRIEGIFNNPDFLNVQVLITECSYLGIDKVEEHQDEDEAEDYDVVRGEGDNILKCKARGHIHLNEIYENREKFNNKLLILCHFSRRYRKEEILDKVSWLNNNFNGRTNVVPFI